MPYQSCMPTSADYLVGPKLLSQIRAECRFLPKFRQIIDPVHLPLESADILYKFLLTKGYNQNSFAYDQGFSSQSKN